MEEMLDIAGATGDADLLITGHARACVGYCCAGEFTRLWSTSTRCWTSTTTKSIAILQTSLTRIPKLDQYLRVDQHLDAWLPGPGIAAERRKDATHGGAVTRSTSDLR